MCLMCMFSVYCCTSGQQVKTDSVPYRPQSHHIIFLPLLPFQVLLCVFQLVWHQAEFRLHVADDFLQI